MAHRQVREDEVAGSIRSIQVSDSSHRHAGKHGHRLGHGLKTGLSDWTGGLEGGEQEEVRVVIVGDVRPLLAFENA